ncbi:unnamed protein product [Mytilus coruscus]|uniref:Uncharacterized protein n=1 Tax=Mytilus coruscus TaxID=42192 RepID=A0A6J8AK16_MYTCO|nr:unnamed protein product [Mytilus coruscus]
MIGWPTALLNWPPVELTVEGQLRASWPSVEQIVEGQLRATWIFAMQIRNMLVKDEHIIHLPHNIDVTVLKTKTIKSDEKIINKVVLVAETLLLVLEVPEQHNNEFYEINLTTAIHLPGYPTDFCFVSKNSGFLVSWKHISERENHYAREHLFHFSTEGKLLGIIPFLGTSPFSFFPVFLNGDPNIEEQYPGYGTLGWRRLSWYGTCALLNTYCEYEKKNLLVFGVVSLHFKHADADQISDKKYHSSYVLDTRNITERRTTEFEEQQRSQHASHLTEYDLKADSVKAAIHSLGPLNLTARSFVSTQRNKALELAKFMKANEDLCPLHGTNHQLNMCRGFRSKPLSERLDLVKQKEKKVVNVNKTVILGNGRPTLLSPCDSERSVRLDTIFDKIKLDENEGMSVEDQTFLNMMSSGFLKQDDGNWIAPLPFKPNKLLLENNRPIVERRA